jgi:hypothetical protein
MSAARTHGARSYAGITRRKGYEKMRVLVPLGIRQRDLPPAARYRLDQWARAAATVWAYDRWVSEHGAIDEDGNPPGFTLTWHAARNSAARLFRSLEPDLLRAAEAKHAAGGTLLSKHLDEHYGKAKP